jgi:uncharacterized membrane protein
MPQRKLMKSIMAGMVGLGAALTARTVLRGLRARRLVAKEGIHVVRAMTIGRPRDQLYQYWRALDNLPRFMTHLESVRVLDHQRSRWTVRGPAERRFTWEAEIIEDVPDQLIAWRSLPGSEVGSQGAVRFEDAPGDRGTEVHVDFRYDPPIGALGAAIATLFRREAHQVVADDLHHFKQVMETGSIVLSDATAHDGPHPARPSEEQPERAPAPSFIPADTVPGGAL